MKLPFLKWALAVAGALALVGSAQAQQIIKIGHDQPEASTHHQAALRWKELVESRTDGAYEVQVFAAGALGSGTQMVEQAQAGALEAFALPTGWIAPFAPAVSVLDLPFLFPSREVAYEVVDGPAGEKILAPLEEVNLKGVAFWESGFKQFTGTFPIQEPGDYEGRRIRTMPTPVIQEQFRAFGASPAAIDFQELYSALQQGVVDGQENPIATIASMRFYEVQDFITLSDHGFLAYVVVFNKNFLERQPEDVQKILVDSARDAAQFQRDIIQEREKEHLVTFKEAGVEIIEMSDDQREQFREASQPVYDWYVKEYSSETLDLIQSEVKRVTSD